ncbi:MAG: flagellar basal body rod protein FlgB [Opitutaceae bacterium]|nr:flagellar basal body rod protein FlgB [Opitutaceae bacterium]|tara:strand:+ start:521 stop:904 length:384 start_codon:yes stop_codon:yes gene_type:complete
MIDQILERENYVLAKKMLDVSQARHEAISGNLANAETPGYKRVDIKANFPDELKKLAESNDVESISKLQTRLETDLNSPIVRPDGNNVQLDSELLKMSENAMQYEFLTQYTANSMKRIKTAITGRVQ